MTPIPSEEVRAVVRDVTELGLLAAESRATRDAASDRIQALVAEAVATVPTRDGDLNAEEWGKLSPAEQEDRLAALTRFKDAISVLAGTDGPTNPSSIMFRQFVSNGWVIAMTLFGLIGTLAVLALIYFNWGPATQRMSNLSAAQQTIMLANGQRAEVVLPGPLEQDVLLMVFFMGALGGFIHLTGSIAKFIGNRQFLRSWIIYYILMPVEGSGLAVLVYLMVRVGVLNPASSNGSATQNLNWVGIYALSALAGLFSKQALELLSGVFATVFRRSDAKDAGASAGPGGGSSTKS